VNELFAGDVRTQGVQLGWSSEQFRAAGMFSDGFNGSGAAAGGAVSGAANSDFDNDPSDFALTGRVEFLAMGDWKQFEDFTSWRGSSNALMIGAALHWQNDSEETNSIADDLLLYTIDASWESDGWNLYAAFLGANVDVDGGGDADQYGLVFQGGVFVADDWEIFGRYDVVFGDDQLFPNDEFNVVTFGVNYYIHKHAAKFTADIMFILDETTGAPAVTSTGTGILDSAEEDQFVLRAQFQLVF
jgi:hypothetical protein